MVFQPGEAGSETQDGNKDEADFGDPDRELGETGNAARVEADFDNPDRELGETGNAADFGNPDRELGETGNAADFGNPDRELGVAPGYVLGLGCWPQTVECASFLADQQPQSTERRQRGPPVLQVRSGAQREQRTRTRHWPFWGQGTGSRCCPSYWGRRRRSAHLLRSMSKGFHRADASFRRPRGKSSGGGSRQPRCPWDQGRSHRPRWSSRLEGRKTGEFLMTQILNWGRGQRRRAACGRREASD
jgi:hypothetical protein